MESNDFEIATEGASAWSSSSNGPPAQPATELLGRTSCSLRGEAPHSDLRGMSASKSDRSGIHIE